MGIRTFETLFARQIQLMQLTALKDSVIGIDAEYYLEHLLNPPKETLLPALGGSPLALESTIVKELVNIQTAGFKVHFVFNGLDYGIKDDPFGPSVASQLTNKTAFELYEQDKANDAINVFKTSAIPRPAALYPFLKKVLHDHKFEFTVAPYSALAQLVYYEKHPSHFIDAIYGPSELFMYGADKLITKFTFSYDTYETTENGITKIIPQFVLDDSAFSWIDKRACLSHLSNISADTFVDACLLAGSSLIDTFPPLLNTTLYNNGGTIRDAVNLLMTCGRSVMNVCSQYQDDVRVKEMDYIDRYKRAITGIRHHIVITKEGNVETLDAANAPSDVHDCIGQRLPEELNMYLFRGMIRPRVLNWLASGKILILAPYDGGDSAEYVSLVKDQLQPWRRQAVSLLADSIHRYYQSKEINTKFWFNDTIEQKFNLKDILPSPKNKLRSWRVKAEIIAEKPYKFKDTAESSSPAYLFQAIEALADLDFAPKTIYSKASGDNPLRTTNEIVTNVIWRFLHLREYVDDKHQLTAWGKVLETTITALGPDPKQTEAAFLAVELKRLGLLIPYTMFDGYTGAPKHGSEIDRRHCMLLARVACLGKIRHQPRGYSGPLSRHMLAYHSVVSEVYAGLRDIIDMSLATMFLEGDASREREDWMEVALSLPFYNQESCALGIVVKTYLDELANREDPTSETCREEMKEKGQGWVGYADFRGSLDDAFQLWDAVLKGVRSAPDLTKDAPLWNEVDQWLSRRR